MGRKGLTGPRPPSSWLAAVVSQHNEPEGETYPAKMVPRAVTTHSTQLAPRMPTL